jgi:glycosyltransferase involved in cell wall biosynthesis
MSAGRVLALVPAHNEADRVGDTVRALHKLPEIAEVLVVDDGSSDATAARAIDAGAHCLRLEVNRGKGGALNAGLDALTARVRSGAAAPAALLLADADLGASAERLGALLAPVLDGSADVAIADLPPQPGAGGFGLAMGLARWGIERSTGRRMAEPLSGQRALAWEPVERGVLGPFAPGFGVEVAMTIDALRAGLRVVEVQVDLSHAATGKDWAGIRHRAAQAAAIARQLTRRALVRPRRTGGDR